MNRIIALFTHTLIERSPETISNIFLKMLAYKHLLVVSYDMSKLS